MELPHRLRSAVESALQGLPLASLQTASATLSKRYRAELRDGRLHLSNELAVKAYLATRMPATFAAIRASFSMLEAALPDFAPRTMLDVGAGPGTALWAASDCWTSLSEARMLEASAEAARIGRTLARELPEVSSEWLEGDASRALEGIGSADLVSLAYVLDELPPQEIRPLISRLWALAGQALVIVEPGTPAGWQRILQARQTLREAGAHMAAPCPHQSPCPIEAPDWCHFARRVARSRIHRMAKGGEVPWEDEKYIFLAATRDTKERLISRVIAPPKTAKGRVELKLCGPDGNAGWHSFSKRDGEDFRLARRADWGDEINIQL